MTLDWNGIGGDSGSQSMGLVLVSNAKGLIFLSVRRDDEMRLYEEMNWGVGVWTVRKLGTRF